MATVKKTMIKKAKDGIKAQPKPRKPVLNYDRLQQGVDANDSEGGYGKSGRTPSSSDSAFYRSGYGRGLRGGKEYPNEPNVQRMGRWEAHNDVKAIKDAKAAVSKKKNGGMMKAKSGASFPDLNKDGKITKADILKGRGVIAKKGASVKAKSGMHKMPGGSMMKNSMMKSGGKMKTCKYGC